MADCQRLSLSANHLGPNEKQVCPQMGQEDVLSKDLREIVTSWKGVKREASNRLGRGGGDLDS